MEIKFRIFFALSVVLLFTQRASSEECARDDCILLIDCPALHGLLRNPTRDSIRELQRVTCFIRQKKPWVCCPQPPRQPPTELTTQPPTQPPTPPPTQPPTRPPTQPPTQPPSGPRPSLLPEDCGLSAPFRVFGGEDAPIYAYPWQAAIGYTVADSTNFTFECGGSVISDRYILTAAHCVNPATLIPRNLNLEIVRLGDWDLSTEVDCQHQVCAPPAQNFGIEEVIEHPHYNTRTRLSDDIALIRLNKSIDFFASAGYVSPICLPAADLSLSETKRSQGAVVAGWGLTESGFTSQKLQHLVLPFFGNQLCNQIYRGSILNEQFCMGGEAGKDSCRGDSGGPLLIQTGFEPERSTQIGLVSYGPIDCGQKGFPGVYTSIRHYRSWIEENMRP